MLSAVILVALNLRAPIAAISPVILDVQTTLGIGASAAGLLTTLPVLCFAVAAPAVAVLGSRTGADRAILIGLVGIVAGTVLRSVDGLVAVLAGTLLIGVAITTGNVLVPVVIKRDFDRRAGSMTGIYTAALAAGAALSAAFTAPIATTLGWRNALASWAVLALVAAVVWPIAFPRKSRSAELTPAAHSPGVWRSGVAWSVALFLGAQSSLYYCITAWLPTLLTERAGVSVSTGGTAMSLYQLLGIVSTLLFPIMATRRSSQSGLTLVVTLLWTTTLTGLLLAPSAWLLWSVVGGLAQGAGISLACTLVILRAGNVAVLNDLSGMSQAVGYSLGAAGPLLIGAVYDRAGNWTPPLLTTFALAVLLFGTGILAGRDRRIGGPA